MGTSAYSRSPTGRYQSPHHVSAHCRQGELGTLVLGEVQYSLPNCANAQRSWAGDLIGPTFTIFCSLPSLPQTGRRHRGRTSPALAFIVALLVSNARPAAGNAATGATASRSRRLLCTHLAFGVIPSALVLTLAAQMPANRSPAKPTSSTATRLQSAKPKSALKASTH
jgi:hypothetical protein